jgi:hypothetical protein
MALLGSILAGRQGLAGASAQNGGGSSTFTNISSGGGTRGTLASEGLYSNPNASNQGLNEGTRSVAGGLAYNRSVQPSGLVENRLVDLLKTDNPYIQQAIKQGERTAANRGLLNSSIAAGTSQAEAYKAGLPIAAADASAINTAEGQNVDVLNQNLMQQRDLMNQMTIAERNQMAAGEAAAAAGRAQEAIANRQMEHDLRMQRERLGYEGEQAGLNRLQQFGLMDREYGLRTQMEDDAAFRQDWLSSENFNREFYGGMSRLLAGAAINSAADFNNMMNQYALENPDIFDQERYSTVSSTMAQNTSNILMQMFANMFGRGG